MFETQTLPLTRLSINKGQIKGLPKNPRFVKDTKFEKLKKSLTDDPEFLNVRPIVAYDSDAGLIVVGGNMRLRALRQLGVKETPVIILPRETPPEKLRAFLIKDNAAFGEWDWDDLANNWDDAELDAWGIDVPTAQPRNFKPSKVIGVMVVPILGLRVLKNHRRFLALYKKEVDDDNNEVIGVPVSEFKTEKYIQPTAKDLAEVIYSLGIVNAPLICPPPPQAQRRQFRTKRYYKRGAVA